MLPDLRFIVGAVLASAVLIVSAFGLAATVRLAQHAKVGPVDSSLAYAEPSDRNPFYTTDNARILDEIVRRNDSVERLAKLPARVEPNSERREPPAELTTGAVDMPAAGPQKAVEQIPTEAGNVAMAERETPATTAAVKAEILAREMPATIESEVPVRAKTALAETETLAREKPATMQSEPATRENPVAVESEPLAPEKGGVVEGEAPERLAELPPPDELQASEKTLPEARASKAKARQAEKAKARRVVRRPRVVLSQPTASTGYPISPVGNNFDNQFFRPKTR